MRYSRTAGSPGPIDRLRLVLSPKPVLHNSNRIAVVITDVDKPDFHLAAPTPLTGGVQAWRIDLNAVAEATARWQSLLSPDERDRASRFHFVGDRLHFAAARGLLRTALAAYLGVEPQDVRFCYAAKGKPELAEPYAASRLAFNVSHSGGVALIALTEARPIGVDVEEIRDDFDTGAIARRFFSAREQEQLAMLPPEKRHRAFFRCWTLKEAFIKALGEGLSHPLHQFDVSLDEQTPVSLSTRPDPSEAENWQLQPIEAGPRHAAAIAVLRR